MQDDSRRVVHVRGTEGMQLALDGAALRLVQPGRAPVWMPLRRIALLVVQGDVLMPASLMSALMLSGAGVRLLATDGTAVADLVPARPEQASTAARLDELIQQVDWRKAYAHWRLRQSLWDAARAVGRGIAVSRLLQLARPGVMGRLLLAPWPSALGVFKVLAPLLLLDAAQLLAEQGWPRERRHAVRPGPDPRRDVAVAMRWAVLRELVRNPRVDVTQAAAWYAARRAGILARGRCTLDAFRRWLADRTGGAG